MNNLTRKPQSLKLDLDGLRQQIGKPIQVAWANRSYFHPSDLQKSNDYRLLVLCSASRRVHGAEMSEGGYIQGAGDDSEGWAYGLTPPVFWANRDILKSTPEDDLPELIKRLVGEHQMLEVARDATLVAPTSNLFISSTGAVNAAEKYDLVIDCNGSAVEGETKRLGLGCDTGKLGSRDLRKSLDKVRDFVSARLAKDSSLSILVTCETGKDLSAGTLLSIICLFYNDEGMYANPRWGCIQALDGKGRQKLKIPPQVALMPRWASVPSASNLSDSVSLGWYRQNMT